MTRITKTVPAIQVFLAVGLTALTGCSTVKSLSPFGGAPYAQDIKPTVAQPAVPDKPAYPAGSKPTTGALPTAVPPVAQVAAPPPAAPKVLASDAPGALASAAPAKKKPAISDEDRKFDDDGQYPNLAKVPARPSDLPSFADANRQISALQADRAAAAEPGALVKVAAATAKANGAVATSRPEDRAPCLGNMPVAGIAKAAVSFTEGSSTLTDAARAGLEDAIPDVRAGQGAVHIVAYGDNVADGAPPARSFNLAMARASSVALALTGFGVPAQRLTVGVSCQGSTLTGPSVRLYLDS